MKRYKYKKIFTRPFSLIRLQIISRGEYDGIKRLTGGRFYFKPLFVFDPKKGVSAYYNISSRKENADAIITYLNKNIFVFSQELLEAEKDYKEVEEIIESGDKKSSLLFGKLVKIQAFSSLGNLVGRSSRVSKQLLGILKKFRYNYDGLAYKAEKFLLAGAISEIAAELRDFVGLMSFEEIYGKKTVALSTVEARKNGFYYFMDEIGGLDELPDFLKTNDKILLSDSVREDVDVKGSIAHGGVVKGRVVVINSKNDFSKFKAGDILVASMTIPDFLPIMKKAAAFVTDEGGITCHAAIVARELKKPCIVGTKIATDVLKDGDLVEVDAERGVVRILNKL